MANMPKYCLSNHKGKSCYSRNSLAEACSLCKHRARVRGTRNRRNCVRCCEFESSRAGDFAETNSHKHAQPRTFFQQFLVFLIRKKNAKRSMKLFLFFQGLLARGTQSLKTPLEGLCTNFTSRVIHFYHNLPFKDT